MWKKTIFQNRFSAEDFYKVVEDKTSQSQLEKVAAAPRERVVIKYVKVPVPAPSEKKEEPPPSVVATAEKRPEPAASAQPAQGNIDQSSENANHLHSAIIAQKAMYIPVDELVLDDNGKPGEKYNP